MMRPPPNVSPSHVPILMVIFFIAAVFSVLDSCVPSPAQAQDQTQSEAIENLEMLLGQYDQGDYHVPTKTSAELATELAVAQAMITGLQTENAALQTEITGLQTALTGLQTENAALQERCP